MSTIRPATVDDSDPLVEMHVRAWQAAYRGILPDAILDGLDAQIPKRTENRRRMLEEAGPEIRNWILETDDGDLIGWAATGPTRDEDLDETSHELYAIYLQPEAIGKGHGKTLMDHCLADVGERGHSEMVMWVLTGNARAQAFYAAAGFEKDARVDELDFENTGAMKLRMRRAL